MDDYEVVAEELSQLAEKVRDLDDRVAEVERSFSRRRGIGVLRTHATGARHRR